MLRSVSLIALGAFLFLALLDHVSAATAGCGKPPRLTSGVHNITVNNKQRRFTLRMPQDYNKTFPYRMTLALHPWGDNMTTVAAGDTPFYGLAALANESTIFVAPDGLNGAWVNQNEEDVAFLDAVRKQIDDDLCVNEKLHFSVGFSFGAAMTYSLACSKANNFRGIAVLSGAIISGCANGTTPIAYYGQHGVRDSVLPIAWGKQIRDHFVQLNGCQAKNATDPAPNSTQHIKTVYDGCKYPTQWISFDGDHVALPNLAGHEGGYNSFTSKAVSDFFGQFS